MIDMQMIVGLGHILALIKIFLNYVVLPIVSPYVLFSINKLITEEYPKMDGVQGWLLHKSSGA